jgi:hypothetical protein
VGTQTQGQQDDLISFLTKIGGKQQDDLVSLLTKFKGDAQTDGQRRADSQTDNKFSLIFYQSKESRLKIDFKGTAYKATN